MRVNSAETIEDVEAEAFAEWSARVYSLRLLVMVPALLVALILGGVGVWLHVEGEWMVFGLGDILADGTILISNYSTAAAFILPLVAAGLAARFLFRVLRARARTRFVDGVSRRTGISASELNARLRAFG